jgi:hypothetical protein
MATSAFGRINVHYPEGPPDLGVTALDEPKQDHELRALLSAARQDTRWHVVQVKVAPTEEQERDVLYDVHVQPADE